MDHLQPSGIQGEPRAWIWLFQSGDTRATLRCADPHQSVDGANKKIPWILSGVAIPYRLSDTNDLNFTATPSQAHVIAQELAFSNDQLQQSIKAATGLHESRIDEMLGTLND